MNETRFYRITGDDLKETGGQLAVLVRYLSLDAGLLECLFKLQIQCRLAREPGR